MTEKLKKGIAAWQMEVHALAWAKGWHEEPVCGPGRAWGVHVDRVLAKLALVHSEVSEAVECVRDGLFATRLPLDECADKPEGMVIELADAVIRIMDLCEAMGYSLEYAMRKKHEYNKTRPHRHGGKLA